MADLENDGFTEEELRLLNEGGDPPPPENEGQSPEALAAVVPPPVAEPAGAEAVPASTSAPAEPQIDPEWQRFAESHTGKTPEELLKIAFDQSKRANREGFQARQAQTAAAAVAQRAQEILEARKAAAAQQKAQFDEALANDPDGATRLLHEQLLQRDISQAEQDAENAVRAAEIEAAYGMASRAIPDLPQRWNQIEAFGVDMGYEPEQVRAISDGRDLIVLHLASITGSLIKAGVMDVTGKMIAAPSATTTNDPRLKTPDPINTLSSAPGRTAAPSTDPMAALQALLSDDKRLGEMTEEELMRLTG